MSRVALYWHTVRHLRPVQIAGRVRHRLARPRIDDAPAPPLRALAGTAWRTPARRRPSLVGPDRFQFLNETHQLAEIGWDDPAIEKLWRYNLHYFDDLAAFDAPERFEWHVPLLHRWVRENPAPHGSGWEPYPTSIRIANWIKWALNGNTLPTECIHSLAVQVRWLSQRLEVHLLGNHLFANAKALVFAGLFFDGAEASAWLARGLRILQRELPEQILDDGGQFERSPMYHALALEDVVDLCNIAAAYPSESSPRLAAAAATWRERLAPMRHWLAVMSHPDGDLAFFNDAAIGIAPTRGELERYANEVGSEAQPDTPSLVTHLHVSGYVRVERGACVALLDVAPIGPDYLPGHAHADTLSFELSLFGQRVFVNSGTSRYGTGPERARERGTHAHNTVVVDGADSSEVWGGFRVARRARPVDLSIACDTTARIQCSHDGYRRLPGRVTHTREWCITDGTATITDRLSGAFARAEARFHLHPGVSIIEPDTSDDRSSVVLRLAGGQCVGVRVNGGPCRVEPSTWHPEFGLSCTSRCLVVDLAGVPCTVTLQWNPTS